MRTLSVILLLVVVAPVMVAQEEPEWQIMPGVSVVKYFQGEDIIVPGGLAYPYSSFYTPFGVSRYSGTGVAFSARCFNDDIKPLAFTFSGGVTWYYQPDVNRYMVAGPTYLNSDVGVLMGQQDFTAFPFSVGVQAVFPYVSRENLMVFAGVEGNIQLISGDVPTGDQAKVGFTVLGGVAVKFLEFGVRYTAFSDIRNLGAYFGLRFKSFGI